MALLESNRIYKVVALSVWSYDEDAETYGSEVSTDRVETFSFTPNYDTDMARSFGVVRDLLGIFVNDQIALTHVGLNATELETITGRTWDNSGSPSTTNRARRANSGEDHPYFGMGVVLKMQNAGYVQRLYARCKLISDSGLTMNAENQFVRPQLTIDTANLKLTDGTEYDNWYEEQSDSLITLDSDFLTALDALRTRTTS